MFGYQQDKLNMRARILPMSEQQSLPMAVVVVVLGILILFVERQWYQIKKLRNLERLHGCKKLHDERYWFGVDFFGLSKAIHLAFHFRKRTSLQYTNSLFQKYGETYSSNVLSYRLIFTCNADNIKHLLSTSFSSFDSAPLRKPIFGPLTPHGIFTVDGAEWKEYRGSMRKRLSNTREIIDLSVCEQHFQNFCQHVPPNGEAFEVQAYASALALDIQILFGLGESIDALSLTQSQAKKNFLEDLHLVKERIVQDGFRGPLRHLSSRSVFNNSCQRIRDYVSASTALSTRRKIGNDQPERDITLFTDQTLDIVLANDSIGTTLTGLFYCLAHDQRVVRKLRESILEAVGDSPPSWEQIGTLHYVRWVLQEVMRLYPPAVFNARTANKHCTLPQGGGTDGQSPILVREGDIVVFSTWASHRLGKQFGEDPEKFYPERWENLASEMPGYIPFNKGPRACPGRHYAMLVLTYTVTRMFQTFSTVSNYNTEEWGERISMTLENEHGVFIGLS